MLDKQQATSSQSKATTSQAKHSHTKQRPICQRCIEMQRHSDAQKEKINQLIAYRQQREQERHQSIAQYRMSTERLKEARTAFHSRMLQQQQLDEMWNKPAEHSDQVKNEWRTIEGNAIKQER